MSRTAAPPKKAVPMCCVTIGYREFLLPADKGMKLVELMQSAFETESTYPARASDLIYEIGEQPRVELKLVRPSQIKHKPTDTNAAGQHLIGMD